MESLLESKEKYEKFRRLGDTQDWQDCKTRSSDQDRKWCWWLLCA